MYSRNFSTVKQFCDIMVYAEKILSTKTFTKSEYLIQMYPVQLYRDSTMSIMISGNPMAITVLDEHQSTILSVELRDDFNMRPSYIHLGEEEIEFYVYGSRLNISDRVAVMQPDAPDEDDVELPFLMSEECFFQYSTLHDLHVDYRTWCCMATRCLEVANKIQSKVLDIRCVLPDKNKLDSVLGELGNIDYECRMMAL